MVLIGLPYHPRKRYAIQHVLDWVDRQTYKDVEVLMRWHLGPFGEKDAVKKQREWLRVIAENMGADYFYSMGTDTIPPDDVIEKLMAHNVDIAGAVYNRRGESGNVPIAWVDGDTEKSFINAPEGLQAVSGMGMDAVLFSRRAFTAFHYFEWSQSDDDYPAYNLLKERGFTIYLDTSLKCRHYMTEDKFV